MNGKKGSNCRPGKVYCPEHQIKCPIYGRIHLKTEPYNMCQRQAIFASRSNMNTSLSNDDEAKSKSTKTWKRKKSNKYNNPIRGKIKKSNKSKKKKKK